MAATIANSPLCHVTTIRELDSGSGDDFYKFRGDSHNDRNVLETWVAILAFFF
jgi:hypothetical protein